MTTPQRSAGSALQIVDEFVEEDEDDGGDEEEQAAPEAHGEPGKTGKLAGFFKSLFKTKDKDKSGSSSKRSSATNSVTKQHPAAGVAPTTSRPSPPATPSSVDPAIGQSPLRSRSTHALVAASPSGTSRLAPSSSKPSTATGYTADGSEAVLVSPAAARSKSITLKAELRSYAHSKSFTELSQKARVIPKRGNEILIASPTAPPRMQRADWSLKDYAVVEKMYKGYASSVYKAFCKRSGELVCLKAYDMAALCELNRFQIYREVQLHGKLAHNNVIGLYGAFQVDSQVVMVQEFADGGDLFTLLHRYGGRMPERQAVEMVLAPCLRVLVYLHEQGILHRDIKPENILFTRNMTLKLCDFGLAIDLRDERAVTRAGTLEYMAPEVLECPFKSRPVDNKDNERLHYSAAVDAWAVGVLAYELILGRPPFEAPEREGVEDCIRRQAPRFPHGLSELARSFMAAALVKDPAQRPSVLEMLAHPFIRGSAPAPAAPAAAAAAASAAGGVLPPSPRGAGGATVLTSAAAQQLQRPAGSATHAGASSGGGGAAAVVHLPAAAPGKSKASSRAVAAAGGMDEEELGMGSMANRMKSYTAGKAVTISHQALQANRHMHLPYVAQQKGGAGAGGGGEGGRSGSGGGGGGGAHQLQAGASAQPHPQLGPSRLAERSLPAGGVEAPLSGMEKLAALNPKLAAKLGGGAGGAGGLMARTASVSRLM